MSTPCAEGAMHMNMNKNEHGKGTLSSMIWLIVLAAVVYAGWNMFPAYSANYLLQDKMNELARIGRQPGSEQKIKDGLMKEVNEQGLTNYVNKADFVITTTDTSRRISVEYDREVNILPGFKKVIHFKAKADALVAF
jgi:hypothetical protein